MAFNTRRRGAASAHLCLRLSSRLAEEMRQEEEPTEPRQWSPARAPKGSQRKPQLGGSRGVTEVNTMGQNVLMSGCKSSSFRVFLLSRRHTPWRETQRDQTRLTAARERGGHGAASGWRPGAPWAGERSGRDGTFTASRHLTVFLCYFLLFTEYLCSFVIFSFSKVDASCSWEAR